MATASFNHQIFPGGRSSDKNEELQLSVSPPQDWHAASQHSRRRIMAAAPSADPEQQRTADLVHNMAAPCQPTMINVGRADGGSRPRSRSTAGDDDHGGSAAAPPTAARIRRTISASTTPLMKLLSKKWSSNSVHAELLPPLCLDPDSPLPNC
jgi:hypothetical protein